MEEREPEQPPRISSNPQVREENKTVKIRERRRMGSNCFRSSRMVRSFPARVFLGWFWGLGGELGGGFGVGHRRFLKTTKKKIHTEKEERKEGLKNKSASERK